MSMCIITGDLLCKTRRRYFLKRIGISAAWDQYKRAINLAKKHYVSDNLEANKGNLHKTWNLINEPTARNEPVMWEAR